MQPRARVKIAENVLRDLAAFVANNEPAMVSEWGDLFISPNLPVAAIRLHKPINDYMKFLTSRNQGQWPDFSKIVPVTDQTFHVVANGAIVIQPDRTTTINGRPAKLL